MQMPAGDDTMTRMNHFRALLNSLFLPQKELGFPHCWWRAKGEIPRDLGRVLRTPRALGRRPRTPLCDVKEELAAWTLNSDKMGFES